MAALTLPVPSQRADFGRIRCFGSAQTVAGYQDRS